MYESDDPMPSYESARRLREGDVPHYATDGWGELHGFAAPKGLAAHGDGGMIEYATDVGRDRLLDTQRYRRERASFLQRRFPSGRIDASVPLAA